MTIPGVRDIFGEQVNLDVARVIISGRPWERDPNKGSNFVVRKRTF